MAYGRAVSVDSAGLEGMSGSPEMAYGRAVSVDSAGLEGVSGSRGWHTSALQARL